MRNAAVLMLVYALLSVFLPNTAGAAEMYYDTSVYEQQFLLGDYEGCIAECIDVLGNLKDEDKDRAQYFLGMSYMKSGDLTRTREVMDELINNTKISKYKQLAYKAIADSYFISEEYIHAMNGYRSFFTKYPNSELAPQVYYNFSLCMLRRGQWIDSRYYLKKITSEYKGSFEASYADDIVDEDMFYYTVEIGSFIDPAQARDVFYRLKADGFYGYLVEDDDKDPVVYKVRVGKFKTKNEAVYLNGELEKAGYQTKLLP